MIYQSLCSDNINIDDLSYDECVYLFIEQQCNKLTEAIYSYVSMLDDEKNTFGIDGTAPMCWKSIADNVCSSIAYIPALEDFLKQTKDKYEAQKKKERKRG